MAQLYPPSLHSLFVASYDSQGYGGGIRPRLHTSFSSVKVTLQLTVSQSVSLGAGPQPGLMTRYLLHFDTVLFLWGALSDERTGLSFVYAASP
jgi:hypothetical protein